MTHLTAFALVADVPEDAMVSTMHGKASYFAFNLFGFVIAVGLVQLAFAVSRNAGTYWAGAGVLAMTMTVYYLLLHPRLKRHAGGENGALYVGFLCGIVLLGLLWAAATGYTVTQR